MQGRQDSQVAQAKRQFGYFFVNSSKVVALTANHPCYNHIVRQSSGGANASESLEKWVRIRSSVSVGGLNYIGKAGRFSCVERNSLCFRFNGGSVWGGNVDFSA